MDEAVGREKISMVCDTFKLDYDSMEINEGCIKIGRVDGNTRTTVVLPLNRVVDAEYWRLFK